MADEIWYPSSDKRKRGKRITPPKGVSASDIDAQPMPPSPMILIVDDSSHNREMYADFLRYSGYRVLEARTGDEALDLARAHQPHLVLMDLAMPQMTGWEAARELKRDPRTRAIKIIALTGHGFMSTRELALEAGCDAFLTKPCPPEVLEHEVERVLADPSESAMPH